MSGLASVSGPPPHRVPRPAPASIAAIIAGALSGVAGGLLFATLHAIIIVPIWDRMTSGLVFGAVAGILLVIAMAGPVPVGRSTRALGIFLAVFPAAILGGIALGLLSPSIFALIPDTAERSNREPGA